MIPGTDDARNGPGAVGYFRHVRIGNRHTGAILVTNCVGVPLEFKYTEPVTATRIHRILYGPVLDRYIHETLIRDRLGREIRTVPEFFITVYDDKDFLGPIAGREAMAVQRHNIAPGDVPGGISRLRDREAIVELESGAVLRLAFSSADEGVQDRMTSWLQEKAGTMDVLEPLERIAAALAALCGEEKKA